MNHHGGGRGGHTPSPGPGARSNTPGSTSSPPVRATPPPPSNPGPALQGAWAAKKTTPSSQEATPPPSENAWGAKKSSSQEPMPSQSSQQTPPSPQRKASWANVANNKEEEAEAIPEVIKIEDKTSEEKEVISVKVVEEAEVKPTTSQVEAKQEELTEVKSNVDDAVTEPDGPETDTVAISRDEASDMLIEEDKSDTSLQKMVADNVTEEEEMDLTVIKKLESAEPALEVTMADSNGNFPTDANENIAETQPNEKVNSIAAAEVKEEKAGDEQQAAEEINSNSVGR